MEGAYATPVWPSHGRCGGDAWLGALALNARLMPTQAEGLGGATAAQEALESRPMRVTHRGQGGYGAGFQSLNDLWVRTPRPSASAGLERAFSAQEAAR